MNEKAWAVYMANIAEGVLEASEPERNEFSSRWDELPAFLKSAAGVVGYRDDISLRLVDAALNTPVLAETVFPLLHKNGFTAKGWVDPMGSKMMTLFSPNAPTALSHMVEMGFSLDAEYKDGGHTFPISISYRAWRTLFPDETVKRLLLSGASPNKQWQDGKTPLHLMAEATVRDDTDKRFWWAFMDAFNLMKNASADIGVKDADGRTPLDVMGPNYRSAVEAVFLATHQACSIPRKPSSGL